MTLELRWIVDCLCALARNAAPPAPDAALDWTRLSALAEAEGLAPALGFAWRTDAAAVPDRVRRRFQRQLVDATARHLLLSDALGRVVKAFASDDIATIALKGPTLAETLYRLPALRPCTDLDLLVHRADVERADVVLRRLGYRRVADAHSFRFDVAHDHATLYADDAGVCVDLHWALLSDPRYSWDERAGAAVWERVVGTEIAGTHVPTLSPDDLLLYLSVHLAVHHGLAGMLWYYDLFLLLERRAAELDWSAIRARAAQWRVCRALAFALRGVDDVFGTRAPRTLMDAIEPRGPRAAALAYVLRRRPPAERRPLEHLIALLLVDRARDLVAPLRQALFPGSAWVEARYEEASTSRVAQYAAHYRRLGQIVSFATLALGRAAGARARVGRGR